MPEIWLPKKAWLSPFALRKRISSVEPAGAEGTGWNGAEQGHRNEDICFLELWREGSVKRWAEDLEGQVQLGGKG